MFNFQNLEIWKKAVHSADFVYSVTLTLPDDDRFGLTSQMRRAAISIPQRLTQTPLNGQR